MIVFLVRHIKYDLEVQGLGKSDHLEVDLLSCWDKEVGDQEDFLFLLWLSFFLLHIVDLVEADDGVVSDFGHHLVVLARHDKDMLDLTVAQCHIPLTV